MELVVLILGVVFLVASVAWHAVDVLASRRLAVRKHVLVSLRSDRAVTGVLWARRGRFLVLKSAEMHEPGANPVPLDGDLVLDRDQVEYVQVTG